MDTICFLLNLFWLIILARMIMSWVRITPGTARARILFCRGRKWVER